MANIWQIHNEYIFCSLLFAEHKNIGEYTYLPHTYHIFIVYLLCTRPVFAIYSSCIYRVFVAHQHPCPHTSTSGTVFTASSGNHNFISRSASIESELPCTTLNCNDIA
jgi:hypothetical protein